MDNPSWTHYSCAKEEPDESNYPGPPQAQTHHYDYSEEPTGQMAAEYHSDPYLYPPAITSQVTSDSYYISHMHTEHDSQGLLSPYQHSSHSQKPSFATSSSGSPQHSYHGPYPESPSYNPYPGAEAPEYIPSLGYTSSQNSPPTYAENLVDPDIVSCFFPESSASGAPLDLSDRFQPSFDCDHPECARSYPRLCDLRKHKKRHQKPYPCRDSAGCGTYFSTEKDRDRHERSKHRHEEHLACTVCGHRTARKDNMKDHVRRRHGEERMVEIMVSVMVGAGTGELSGTG